MSEDKSAAEASRVASTDASRPESEPERPAASSLRRSGDDAAGCGRTSA